MKFNVEITIICENMCEEGSESNYGSEEGLNVFRTLDGQHDQNLGLISILLWPSYFNWIKLYLKSL